MFAGTCSDAIVAVSPNAKSPDTAGQLDFGEIVAGMVGEARDRLASIGSPTETQLALRESVEGKEWPWPWGVGAERLYEPL